MSDDTIRQLEERIAELKRRWPAHSVPPTMLRQLEDLEEELVRELKKAAERTAQHPIPNCHEHDRPTEE